MLHDQGIGLDEVLLLRPGGEGTSVQPASSLTEMKLLLEPDYSLADAIIPHPSGCFLIDRKHVKASFGVPGRAIDDRAHNLRAVLVKADRCAGSATFRAALRNFSES